jgi:hypothetical protein
VRRSAPGAFLIDWVNIALSITSSGIGLYPSGISGSGVLSCCPIGGKAVVLNRASFSSKDTAISPFGPLTVGVVV